jgi:Transposase, Mutator family
MQETTVEPFRPLPSPAFDRPPSTLIAWRLSACRSVVVERYHRRESSVEEALIEMYLAGISVRRVEDITEAL